MKVSDLVKVKRGRDADRWALVIAVSLNCAKVIFMDTGLVRSILTSQLEIYSV